MVISPMQSRFDISREVLLAENQELLILHYESEDKISVG